MVNRGPSLLCGRCRQRNTKCDKARPSCGQCIRQGVECPGYRDHGGLVFKDESRAVADRHARKNRQSTSTSPPSMTSEPAIDPRSVAVQFFFRRFVAKDPREAWLSRGHFDQLQVLYQRAPSDSALALATEAMAARAMLIFFEQNQLGPATVVDERRALAALQAAIVHPVESLRDETLMAVLCLDYAEHLTSSKMGLPPALSHTDGALMLIKHRDKNHVRSRTGDYLVSATRSNITSQNFWRKSRQDQAAVVEFPNSEVEIGTPVMKLHRLLLAVLQLACTMPHHRPQESESIKREKSRIEAPLFKQLDDKLAAWADEAPAEWQVFVGRLYQFGPSEFALPPSVTLPTPHEAFFCGQFLCVRIMALKFGFVSTVNSAYSEDVSAVLTQSILRSVSIVVDRLAEVLKYLQSLSSFNTSREALTAIRIDSIIRTNPLDYQQSEALDARAHLLQLIRWSLSVLTYQIPGSQGFTLPAHQMGWLFTRFHEVSSLMVNASLKHEQM